MGHLNEDMILQLYSNTHFGTLSGAINYCPTQKIFIGTILEVLTAEPLHLPKILHLHQIFMQNIFDKLPFKSDNPEWSVLKQTLVNLLFKNELFNKPRIKINELAGNLTTQVGIAGTLVCSETSITDLHQNILGMFSSNPHSSWGKFIKAHQLPFIAGPSGHTGSAILIASLVGNLNEIGLKTYLTATMGVLVGGGYHTADEVMTVANRTGVKYEPGKYYHLLPKDFLCSNPMRDLAHNYPELLPLELCEDKNPINLSTLGKSVGHGVIVGMSNVIEEVAIQKGCSKRAAYFLNKMCYSGSYFAYKFSEHYLLDETQNCFNTLYQSAIETSQLLVITVVMDSVVNLLQSAQMKRAGHLMKLGLFTLSANSDALSRAATVVTGSLCQTATEYLGRRLFNFKK